MEHPADSPEREEQGNDGNDGNDVASGAEEEEVAEIYQYEPLEDDGSIRLLIIQPEAPLMENGLYRLQCDLLHIRLEWIVNDSDPLAYTALSYVWGNVDNSIPIRIGSKILCIGVNLYYALYHLRLSGLPAVVWADGVCINQIDVDERNHQVHQMKRIYENAMKTVIYLGNHFGNTCLSAWNFLERECDNPQVREAALARVDFQGELDDVENDVLIRPWFNRVWVFQEVVVSRMVVVQCGRRAVSWDSFCKSVLLTKRINDRYGWSLSKKPLVEYLMDIFQARCAYLIANDRNNLLPPWYNIIHNNKGKGIDILTTLSRARRLFASDERDKIYAVLGVSSGVDVNNDSISPDYHKSIREVYTDFAYHMIQSTGSYDILSFRELWPRFDLPSWVPNWRLPLGAERTILSLLEDDDESQKGRRIAEVKKYHALVEGRKLCCLGKIIGLVKATSPKIWLWGREEDLFQRIREKFKDDPVRMNRSILQQWSKFPWSEPNHVYNEVDYIYNEPDVNPEFAENFPIVMDSLLEDMEFYRPVETAQHREIDISQADHDSAGQDDASSEKETVINLPTEISIANCLIHRSRKTTFGHNYMSLEASVIIDSHSIVDNRRFVLYQSQVGPGAIPSLSPDLMKLALASTGVEPGDIIISLKGARLPYVVRELPHGMETVQALSATRCVLIGECLIDDFREHDSVLKGGDDKVESENNEDDDDDGDDSNSEEFIFEESEYFRHSLEVPLTLKS
jgi:Heterokaryon incompatibility protein (HET)